MSCILEIKHLKKYYDSVRGVEDVSLKLNKGDNDINNYYGAYK